MRTMIAAALLIIATSIATAAEWHVDCQAAGPGDGTTEDPFTTIQHGVEAAAPGDIVTVRAGTYRESVRPPRGGSDADHRIVIRGAPGQRPVISGTQPIATISAGAWERLPGPDPIYAIELSDAFTSSLNQAEQVFVDGAMLQLARYPDIAPGRDLLAPGFVAGYAPGYLQVSQVFEEQETILEQGADTPWGPVGKGGATRFTIGCDALKGSHAPEDIIGATIWLKSEERHSWGYGHLGPVLDYDPASGEIEAIVFVQGFVFSATQARTLEVGTPFYLLDHPSLLTAPGEYYHDASNDRLLVWLPDGGDPSEHAIELKRRDYAFDLSARSYVTIEGFAIHAATITTDTDYGTGAGMGAWVAENRGWYDGAAGNASARAIILRDLDIAYPSHFWGTTGDSNRQWTQSSGVMIVGADHVVESCRIAYSAGCGISLYGYNHRIRHNLVHDCNYAGAYAPGIEASIGSIGGDVDTTAQISYNTVLRCGFDGIGCDALYREGETASRIHHNRVDAAGLICKDVGGITVHPGKESLEDLRVDHNWVSNVWAALGNGIYFDFDVDFIVDHNLITDGNVGIHLNGPDGAQVYHNTVLTRDGIGGNDTNSSWGMWANSSVHNNLATGGIIDAAPGEGFASSHNLEEADAAALLVAPPQDVALRADASTARDAGLAIPGFNDDAVDAPDIGCSEHGSPADQMRWWMHVGADLTWVADAPDDLRVVQAASDGTVTLRWRDNSDNESGFLIERVQRNYLHPNGDWQTTTVGRVAANITEFTDQIAGRVDYMRYRVRAIESPATPVVGVWAGRSGHQTTTFEADQGYDPGALDGQGSWYNLDNSNGIGRADAWMYEVESDGDGGQRLALVGDGGIGVAGGDYIVQFGNLLQSDPDYRPGTGSIRFAFTLGMRQTSAETAAAMKIGLGGLNWSWRVPDHIGRPLDSLTLQRNGALQTAGYIGIGDLDAGGADPDRGVLIEAVFDQDTGTISWSVDGVHQYQRQITARTITSAFFTIQSGVVDADHAVWLDDLVIDALDDGSWRAVEIRVDPDPVPVGIEVAPLQGTIDELVPGWRIEPLSGKQDYLLRFVTQPWLQAGG